MAHPNVVFILIDDMGWKDIACMGSEFYETPNIDRLAREGMLFTDAYAACPVCSPTRASIMSGKYPARLGLTHYIGGPDHCLEGSERGRVLSAPYIPYLPLEEKSLASSFRQNGYRTWHVGKWHMGSEKYWPENHGFDINIGGCHAGHPPAPNHYFAPWNIPTLTAQPGDEYLTDRLGDEAARLIRENDDRPFFLNLCFYQVHTPIMAKADKIRKYEAKAAALGLDQMEALVPGDWHPAEHRRHERIMRRVVQSNPVYAAMIEHLDENVGKVLQALEDRNIAEDTIVVFTSDNGGLSTAEGSPTCNAPLSEGKGWMYEGGCREPLLIRWPGTIAAGRRSSAVVTSPDFYPTLLEACGLPPEPRQHVDGISFAPLLADETLTPEREPVFWHFPHYGNQGGEPGCSIRWGDWKLIEFFGKGCELYNLRQDIGEEKNVLDEFPETARRLQARLAHWRSEVNALIPAANPDWKPWREADLASID
jgi:arylsulfatase A-like enzyme